MVGPCPPVPPPAPGFWPVFEDDPTDPNRSGRTYLWTCPTKRDSTTAHHKSTKSGCNVSRPRSTLHHSIQLALSLSAVYVFDCVLRAVSSCVRQSKCDSVVSCSLARSGLVKLILDRPPRSVFEHLLQSWALANNISKENPKGIFYR